MIDIRVTCDDCGRSSEFIPLEADKYKLSDHLRDIGYRVHKTGILKEVEHEYCVDCMVRPQTLESEV